ncbi:hypothetical protein BT69DRAFT_444173 [Atractiella rhizophila]|nr:hypothetical protein BT69DRAFT_444173 [Atractiella rhizophila]
MGENQAGEKMTVRKEVIPEPLPRYTACLACKARKVRCDGARPACGRCSKRYESNEKAPACQWPPDRKRRRKVELPPQFRSHPPPPQPSSQSQPPPRARSKSKSKSPVLAPEKSQTQPQPPPEPPSITLPLRSNLSSIYPSIFASTSTMPFMPPPSYSLLEQQAVTASIEASMAAAVANTQSNPTLHQRVEHLSHKISALEGLIGIQNMVIAALSDELALYRKEIHPEAAPNLTVQQGLHILHLLSASSAATSLATDAVPLNVESHSAKGNPLDQFSFTLPLHLPLCSQSESDGLHTSATASDSLNLSRSFV